MIGVEMRRFNLAVEQTNPHCIFTTLKFVVAGTLSLYTNLPLLSIHHNMFIIRVVDSKTQGSSTSPLESSLHHHYSQ